MISIVPDIFVLTSTFCFVFFTWNIIVVCLNSQTFDQIGKCLFKICHMTLHLFEKLLFCDNNFLRTKKSHTESLFFINHKIREREKKKHFVRLLSGTPVTSIYFDNNMLQHLIALTITAVPLVIYITCEPCDNTIG